MDRVEVLDRGAQLCAIVTCYISGAQWKDVRGHLHDKGINCSFALQKNNQLDFGPQGKNVPWALRLSPHYYNTEGEIEFTLDSIREFVS